MKKNYRKAINVLLMAGTIISYVVMIGFVATSTGCATINVDKATKAKFLGRLVALEYFDKEKTMSDKKKMAIIKTWTIFDSVIKEQDRFEDNQDINKALGTLIDTHIKDKEQKVIALLFAQDILSQLDTIYYNYKNQKQVRAILTNFHDGVQSVINAHLTSR